ncbi:MAG: Mrp/NBP35 family ATP-binding protein, partial [Alphaproteobacteria bacterium]|nr:Mrp/NBP35 family ATP-binding protein [Alphaproteobacteria bacterium]
MTGIDEATVRAALGTVVDPSRGVDLVTAGMVESITIRDGNVAFVLTVEAHRGAGLEPVRAQAEAVVLALPGVTSASGIMTAASAGPGARPAFEAEAPSPSPVSLAEVRHVIAVASGKGGVGKSTTSANLAVALALEGRSVGLLDADVYGPSQPRMLGVTGRPRPLSQDTVAPLENYGVKLISMGLLAAEDTPIAWRGPMVQSALQQMLTKVAWGSLDYLVIDLPPGTGDVPISMVQQTPISGVVVVCTPQDIALLDARKAIAMLRRADVPILGIIENMSFYQCPECGRVDHIFGHGGAVREAERHGVPLLGAIPLDTAVRESGDAGTPIVVAKPDGVHAAAFRAVARAVMAAVEVGTPSDAQTAETKTAETETAETKTAETKTAET